jgi:mono/diheme cytochrome c family protein
VEYLKEIDPDYVASPLDRSGAVFQPYRAPLYAADAATTPYERATMQAEAYAQFKENILEAMRSADVTQLAKLQEDFPEIFAAYTAQGGKLPAGAAPAEADVPTITEPITDAAILATAKGLFEMHCATCHGKAGEGGIGPNLTDEYWLHGGKLANVIRTVTKGIPAKGMIAWDKTLTPDEINAVSSYVLVKLQGSNPSNPKAPEGEKIAD